MKFAATLMLIALSAWAYHANADNFDVEVAQQFVRINSVCREVVRTEPVAPTTELRSIEYYMCISKYYLDIATEARRKVLLKSQEG